MTATLIGVGAFAARSYAQFPVLRPPGPAPVSPAVYSPYLNLLRNGNPTYINYYGLVRPELDFRSQIYGLQQGVATNSAVLSGVESATGMPLTGHPTQFLNTSHYFLNRGGQSSPGAAAPAAGFTRPAATAMPTPRY